MANKKLSELKEYRNLLREINFINEIANNIFSLVLRSNFLGRDGFRWWWGQIAPEDAQADQLNMT